MNPGAVLVTAVGLLVIMAGFVVVGAVSTIAHGLVAVLEIVSTIPNPEGK